MGSKTDNVFGDKLEVLEEMRDIAKQKLDTLSKQIEESKTTIDEMSKKKSRSKSVKKKTVMIAPHRTPVRK